MVTPSTLPIKLLELSRGLELAASVSLQIKQQQKVPYEYEDPDWWTVVFRVWTMAIWGWWCTIT